MIESACSLTLFVVILPLPMPLFAAWGYLAIPCSSFLAIPTTLCARELKVPTNRRSIRVCSLVLLASSLFYERFRRMLRNLHAVVQRSCGGINVAVVVGLSVVRRCRCKCGQVEVSAMVLQEIMLFANGFILR